MNISEINQRNLSLLDVNQLKAFLDIFKGVSNPKAKVVIKDLTRELGTRKMEAVEEASVKDIIKAVKAAAKKIGGIIDKVFDDKGFQDAYAKYVDNPKDKNRLKKIQDYTTNTPRGQQKIINILHYWGKDTYAKGGEVKDVDWANSTDIVDVGVWFLEENYKKGNIFQSERYNISQTNSCAIQTISKKTIQSSKRSLIILHPLPRNNELNTDLDTHIKSKYFQQANNGVYVRMAILKYICLKYYKNMMYYN